jgi:DNA transformation protein and related proteins
MPLDRKYANQVLEMLRPLGIVTGRAMFGGFGIWENGAMFALLDSESVLYFKTDVITETAYQAEGSTQFAPQVGEKPPTPMPYWSAPVTILDDQEEFEKWAKQAISIAHANARANSSAPAPKKKAPAKKTTAKPKAAKKTTTVKKPTTKKKGAKPTKNKAE